MARDFEPAQYLVLASKDHPIGFETTVSVDRVGGREELTTKALIRPKAAKAIKAKT